MYMYMYVLATMCTCTCTCTCMFVVKTLATVHIHVLYLYIPSGRPSFTCSTMSNSISLGVAPTLMEKSYQSIPNRVVMAHTEWY